MNIRKHLRMANVIFKLKTLTFEEKVLFFCCMEENEQLFETLSKM